MRVHGQLREAAEPAELITGGDNRRGFGWCQPQAGDQHLAGDLVDIDQPADIAAFLRLGRDTATLALLNQLKVGERILASTPRG